MFYISIFGIILGGYLFSLCKCPMPHIDVYKIIVFILWGVLAFRYGQGSDYFSYKIIYEYCGTWEYALYNPYGVHSEIGYRILCYCFRGRYEVFIIALSSFEMWMLYRGIRQFSQNKWMTVYIFFPTGYMSYYFSSFREGIAIATFIGYLLKCMEEKKWIKYYTVVLLLGTIHSSALILLLPPIIIKFSYKGILRIMIILSLSGVLVCLPFVQTVIGSIPYIGNSVSYYFANDYNILAMGERVGYLIFIFMLLNHISEKKIKKEIKDFIKLYCFGVGTYFFFASSSLIASRLMIYFKLLEIFIIPYLLKFPSRWSQLLRIICIMLIILMLIKNINSYLLQGMYNSDVSFFEYPYITIYNKEKLLEYRQLPYWIDIRKEIQIR